MTEETKKEHKEHKEEDKIELEVAANPAQAFWIRTKEGLEQDKKIYEENIINVDRLLEGADIMINKFNE